MEKICSVDRCGKKLLAKGLCSAHYMQKRRAERPELRESDRLKSAKYRRENPEKYRVQRAKYRVDNPEKVKAATAKWRKENPVKVRAMQTRRPKRTWESRKKAHEKWRASNPNYLKEYKARKRGECADFYVREVYELPKEAPQEVVEVYRVILQIKRELRK